MRVGLDGTPLVGRRTGVGHYVAGLLSALAELAGAPRVSLALFTPRSPRALQDAPRAPFETLRRSPVPARVLVRVWLTVPWPPVEWLSGPVDVFHGTNFVQPPTRRAAGVLTIHDLAYLKHPTTVTRASARYRALVPRSLARGAVVCTPTAAVRGEVLEAYRIAEERTVVTPLGVRPAFGLADPPSAAWLAARGLPPRYILFVGTREPRKNLALLLAAHRALRAADPETPALVLAGPPGWEEPPDRLAGGTTDGVVAIGYLSDEDLARVMAGAACLAHPSRYEGFGLTALEALACGIPVVAADVPALREVLGEAAAFVPVDDADALAGAIQEALRDGIRPAARAARRSHASAFTWERCALSTMAAYQRAVSG